MWGSLSVTPITVLVDVCMCTLKPCTCMHAAVILTCTILVSTSSMYFRLSSWGNSCVITMVHPYHYISEAQYKHCVA